MFITHAESTYRLLNESVRVLRRVPPPAQTISCGDTNKELGGVADDSSCPRFEDSGGI